MKKGVLYIILLILSNNLYAQQCICGHIRFAVADTLEYSYKYYEKGDTSSKIVKFISYSDQLHINDKDSANVVHSHESYGVYDKESDSIVTILHDNRNYVYFHIDYMGEFVIEITNKETTEVMVINFQKSSYDITYNILVSFRKGNYNIDLTNLWNYFYEHYDEPDMKYKESKIEKVKSNFKTNKYSDWIKICELQGFK